MSNMLSGANGPMDYYRTSHGNVTWQSLDKLNNCEAISAKHRQFLPYKNSIRASLSIEQMKCKSIRQLYQPNTF